MLNSRPCLHKVKIMIIRNTYLIDCIAIFHSESWPQVNITQKVTFRQSTPFRTSYTKYQSLCNGLLFSPLRAFVFCGQFSFSFSHLLFLWGDDLLSENNMDENYFLIWDASCSFRASVVCSASVFPEGSCLDGFHLDNWVGEVRWKWYSQTEQTVGKVIRSRLMMQRHFSCYMVSSFPSKIWESIIILESSANNVLCLSKF